MPKRQRVPTSPWARPDKRTDFGEPVLQRLLSFNKKVIIVNDLDGYVLDYPTNPDDATWDPKALQGLKDLQKLNSVELQILTASRAPRVRHLLRHAHLRGVTVHAYYGLETMAPNVYRIISTPELNDIVARVTEMDASLRNDAGLSESDVAVVNEGAKVFYRPVVNTTLEHLGEVLSAVPLPEGAKLQMRFSDRWELSYDHGFTKAFAMKRILKDNPDAVIVYGGDDHNDLPAMRLVRQAASEGRSTFLIAVRNTRADKGKGSPDELAELADVVCDSPQELGELFTDAAEVVLRAFPEFARSSVSTGLAG